MSQTSRASNNNKDIDKQKTPSPKGNSPEETRSQVKTASEKPSANGSPGGQHDNVHSSTASVKEPHSRNTASRNLSKQQSVRENQSNGSKKVSRHGTAPEHGGYSLHSRDSHRVGHASAHQPIYTGSRATIQEAHQSPSIRSKASGSIAAGSGGSGRSGSIDKLSARHSNSIDESVTEESVINYSSLDFRALEYDRDVANARVLLHAGPEACNCYPQRSSRAIPSMIYDKVKCVHHGLVGYTHDGVCDFDDGWRSTSQQGFRRQSLQQEDTSFFKGYPQPLLERFIESQRSSMMSEEELKHLLNETSFSEENISSRKTLSKDITQETKIKTGTTLTPSRGSVKTSSRKTSTNREASEEGIVKALTSSQQWNMKLPVTPDKRPTSVEIRGLDLPKIGHSPPPPHRDSCKSGSNTEGTQEEEGRQSTKDSRLSFENRKPATLFTPLSDDPIENNRSSTSPKIPTKMINKNRTFQGKYYDPIKDEVVEYEVTHEFGKHINRWSTKQVHVTQ